MKDWPRYCCAILRDRSGRYLLEKRPSHEEDAPGMLTCFGGGREVGEDPDACIRRELTEELGFEPARLELCVRLMGTSGRVIAWFYRAEAPSSGLAAIEEGFEAVWAAWEELPGLPVGNWNIAAIRAEAEGVTVAVVEG
jgi:8-oxo-dGTP pyrophosphatase MutT (NUDIX family)